MAWSDNEHKVGDKVWVYAFNHMGGKTGRLHNVPPQYGVLEGTVHEKYSRVNRVRLYKKDTEELSKKDIDILSVSLAYSYEEAVEQYNRLVQKEIDFYKSKLKQVEDCLIQ